MITTTVYQTPCILTNFDEKLLSKPYPFKKGEESFYADLEKVEKKFKRKLKPKHYAKIEALKKQIKTITEKKENGQTKIPNKTEEPLYCPRCDNERDQKIFWGFKFGYRFVARS